jgi:hypothetical protein
MSAPATRRRTRRLIAVPSSVLVVVAAIVVPTSAAHASVNPTGWFWSWWYDDAHHFQCTGTATGVTVAGSGTDHDGTRTVKGTLTDRDPNDGACASVEVFGPARGLILERVNCNGEPPYPPGLPPRRVGRAD